MTSHRCTLEMLPDTLQTSILEYLSIYDCYYSLFPLNHRYATLIKRITPDKIDTNWLDKEIARAGVLISDYWAWNDRFVYWLVPRLQPNAMQWLFLPTDSIEQYIATVDTRVRAVLTRYEARSNAPGFLVCRANYYFCSIPDELPRLENWIEENYPAQYEVIRNHGARQHLPKRINHDDGRHLEVKQALAEVHCLERFKRKNIIHQCAQLIWTAVKTINNFTLLDFNVDENV